MQSGDPIRVCIINEAGSIIEIVALIRCLEGSVFVDITPENSGGVLKRTVQIELIPRLIHKVEGREYYNYQGEIAGAVLVPLEAWNSQPAMDEPQNQTVPATSSFAFPLPRRLRKLIRNLPSTTKDLPKEVVEYHGRLMAKLGKEKWQELAKVLHPLMKYAGKSLPKGATIEDAYRMLFEVQRQVTSASPSLRATVPVIGYDAVGNLENEGSGVLIQISSEYFLLTAAHVLQISEGGSLYAGIGNSMVMLNGTWCKTKTSPDLNLSDLDIGYCNFTDLQTIAKLDFTSGILQREDVIIDETMQGISFRVCGFPAQKTDHSNGGIITDVTSYEGFEIQPAEYPKLGLNPKYHIAIKYNGKRMFSPVLKRTFTPMKLLKGMSGGGIYVEVSINEPPFIKFLLFAITTVHDRGRALFIGTRLNQVIRLVHSKRPELFQKAMS